MLPKSKALQEERTEVVDVAGIDARILTLPRAILEQIRFLWAKKSAEAIVVAETRGNAKPISPRAHGNDEGPNIESRPDSNKNATAKPTLRRTKEKKYDRAGTQTEESLHGPPEGGGQRRLARSRRYANRGVKGTPGQEPGSYPCVHSEPEV